MPRLFNLNSHKALRKTLRREATVAERKLWRYLKKDQIANHRFRRQFGIGRYIVDFYCPAERLAIEVDGSSHDNKLSKQYDNVRTEFLSFCGIRILRFSNADVMERIDEVILRIWGEITFPSASPYPPSEFRRGTKGEVIDS